MLWEGWDKICVIWIAVDGAPPVPEALADDARAAREMLNVLLAVVLLRAVPGVLNGLHDVPLGSGFLEGVCLAFWVEQGWRALSGGQFLAAYGEIPHMRGVSLDGATVRRVWGVGAYSGLSLFSFLCGKVGSFLCMGSCVGGPPGSGRVQRCVGRRCLRGNLSLLLPLCRRQEWRDESSTGFTNFLTELPRDCTLLLSSSY